MKGQIYHFHVFNFLTDWVFFLLLMPAHFCTFQCSVYWNTQMLMLCSATLFHDTYFTTAHFAFKHKQLIFTIYLLIFHLFSLSIFLCFHFLSLWHSSPLSLPSSSFRFQYMERACSVQSFSYSVSLYFEWLCAATCITI